jgi:hypothetical protein
MGKSSEQRELPWRFARSDSRGALTAALLLSLVLLGLGVGARNAAAAEIAFPLELVVIDPESKDELPPFIVMFEKGKDQKDRDVRGPLGRLETLRGPSKMFPESNDDPGLPVVLRGLRLHEERDGCGAVLGYSIELLGEFNTVKVAAPMAEVEKLVAGNLASFSLRGAKNYGVYAYESNIRMDLQLVDDELFVQSIDGDFNFREGFTTYTSRTKQLRPPAGKTHLYRGRRGELPKLQSI